MRNYKPVLVHHGILGQKWGEKNGPPYPLKGGDYSVEERKFMKRKTLKRNSAHNKRHFDTVLKAKRTTLQTLSYDKDRTKNTDMFYASHDVLDNNVYKALLNNKVPKPLYDKDGNVIGTEKTYRFAIKNGIKSDIKVASEDSAADIFMDLYKKDRDFYNFVTDESRMQKYFVDEKLRLSGYKEAKDTLTKMKKDPNYKPSSQDLQKVYRMFNFVIPYDGGKDDSRGAKDILTQRTKFFKLLKEAGYGACLDTNDSLYNGLHARSPIIMFDMDQIIPKDILNTSFNDKVVGIASLPIRKTFGL